MGVQTVKVCYFVGELYTKRQLKERVPALSKRSLALPKAASSRAITATQAILETLRKHCTALSKYIWNLKDINANFSLKWKIIKRCKTYSARTKRCNLCLHEKLIIIRHPEMATLNSRSELLSSCRHRKKHLLSTH